ncbi:MAG TPA: VIT and VWA domain-containing protein [Verrucomicrobiae bacterium]|jgi:Ca-activated chloride channel family protein
MNNRLQNPTPARRAQFGLIAWLEQTRVCLPLKGVECRFTVCGQVLNVEIDQIFHQNSPQPLDCLYSFPLPAAAAVYRCEMQVNDRIIRAKVEEVERAREMVREKKAAGHRTALVEVERDNLFTLSLGNVQPEDVIVVRLAYFQTLTRLADWTSLSIPFCPGVRYIPGRPLLRANAGRGVVDDTDQVPDASRLAPPRIDRLHPDAAYLSVEGVIEDPIGAVKDVSSPSHPVLVRDGKGAATVEIADGAAVPDCDFVVRWTESKSDELKPLGWVMRSEKENYALVRLRAPAGAEVAPDYAQDIYFLVDRSGSMSGLKWAKAAQAFREFIKTLGPNDRVWATFFESTFRDLAEKPLSAAKLLLDETVQQLEALGTAGGTEMLPALAHVLESIAKHSADRPASLLVITDGQVGNESEILERLRQHPNLRAHTFGIDTAVNDGFLQALASQQRGTSYLMTPNDDIVGTVARLGDRLRRPVLTSIRAKGAWELADESFPDLHAGEILSLALKGSPKDNEVIIEGQLPDGSRKSYRFDLERKNLPALPLLWASRRIKRHLAAGRNESALALARKYNLICAGAAFVAWDEAEKVAVSGPDREVYQPVLIQRMDTATYVGSAGYSAGMGYAAQVRQRVSSGRSSGLQSRLEDKPLSPEGEAELLRLFPDRSRGLFFKRSWKRGLAHALEGIAQTQHGWDRDESVERRLAALQDWCTAMFRLYPFRSEPGWAFIKVICEWLLADLSQWDERCKRVQLLPKLLLRGDGSKRFVHQSLELLAQRIEDVACRTRAMEAIRLMEVQATTEATMS